MVSSDTNRQFIPALGYDPTSIRYGLAWLLNSDDETLVQFHSTRGNRHESIYYELEAIFGKDIAYKSSKEDRITIDEKIIHQLPNDRHTNILVNKDALGKKEIKIKNERIVHLITDKKLPLLQGPLRLLACWANSCELEELESRYQISNLLVITWGEEEIMSWKQKKPSRFKEYDPPRWWEEEW